MASDSALLERLARRKSIFCLLSFEELLFLYEFMIQVIGDFYDF